MRIFVTGATGFVGSAVVRDLLSAGHDVLGMTRSEEGAAALASGGAEVHRGNLDDLDSLRAGAAGADAVIHTAFNHDFSKFAEHCAGDFRAIQALGSALEGTDRPLLVTGGLAGLASGRIATEADVAPSPSASYPRASEQAMSELVARGVRASVVRLPASTHGEGDHGFVPLLIDIARAKGVSAYIGDGMNRWPAGHRLDAARVYRLAIEEGAVGGPYHAVSEEGVPFREIAEVIGRRLNLPVVGLDDDEAVAHFGWFVKFAGMDAPTSSAQTRERLGWEPVERGLLADLDQPAYFDR